LVNENACPQGMIAHLFISIPFQVGPVSSM